MLSLRYLRASRVKYVTAYNVRSEYNVNKYKRLYHTACRISHCNGTQGRECQRREQWSYMYTLC